METKKILWISHSAISSFKRCPHLYYLEYVYHNPRTGNRIQVINPYLALGSAVHETIEELLDVPIKKRVQASLKDRFYEVFEKYRGFEGGFISPKKEKRFLEKGVEMVTRVEKSSLLRNPSVGTGTKLPTVNLLGESVKLVGSLDWVEALPKGGYHIIDFKTGNNKEKGDSLQLPIYTVLAEKNLQEKVKKVSYWYLQYDSEPVEQKIRKTDEYFPLLKEKAEEIQKAVEENSFPCHYEKKCFGCRDYEKVFQGEAVKVKGRDNRNKDVFCVFKKEEVIEKVMEEDFLDEREKKIFELRMKKPMEKVNKELRLTRKKSEEIVTCLKEKLKKNLHKKELKVVINTLQE